MSIGTAPSELKEVPYGGCTIRVFRSPEIRGVNTFVNSFDFVV